MTTDELARLCAWIIIIAVIGATAYFAGMARGIKRGADIGWLHRQEQIWADEKARRDARGRFQRKGNL
jgi:hypothetical protein